MLKMLPKIEHHEVAHVGSLDLSKKQSSSYEGRCLSVSTVPTSWAQIAKLGDAGFILSGRGHFINALALSNEERQEILAWASHEGFLDLKDIVRLHEFDSERNVWFYSDYSGMAEANSETKYMEEEDFRLESMTAYMCTKKLAEVTGYSGAANVSSATSFDLSLIEYAARHFDVDGVWWEEKLDIVGLSAPRGAIFPERVSQFTVRAATWDDLVEFESNGEAFSPLISSSSRWTHI